MREQKAKRHILFASYILVTSCLGGGRAANAGELEFKTGGASMQASSDRPDVLVRHKLELKKYLVSPPAMLADNQKGFFVYLPDDFRSLIRDLKKIRGMKTIVEKRTVPAALLELDNVEISVTETWADWATLIFRPIDTASTSGK
jgi:hypothetical protein